MGLAIDGAFVPMRPERARGRRAGRKRQRVKCARWRGQWRDAKEFRFYLLDGERIVQVLSGHQVQDAQALGDAFLAPSRVNSAHQLREMHAGERVPHCRGATAP
jgi:hypothetical protein